MGASAYNCSKLAQLKLLQYVSVENPDLFVVSAHPGAVDTDMLRSSGLGEKIDPAMFDDGKSSPVHDGCDFFRLKLLQ